ncbi:fork head domain-containing protein [Halteromyces radiatus]|uniref:fork head domain-containing protein n=1 Tax=Halteromyces radiatus TaxID=101107 RepID=UPI00221ED64A|nr:fork head domain-containing protein [Halteromyces radiatus]KAI8078785.1 fork head domain-containing protein [Halteromyces radiatus]
MSFVGDAIERQNNSSLDSLEATMISNSNNGNNNNNLDTHDKKRSLDERMDNKEHRYSQLPNIPVAMRYPSVISSVKQYRVEDQQQHLKQPFVSESFIPMMPNIGKPPRKRRRPPFSYSSLIAQAILEAENERMTLREIYQWIVDKYPALYSANDVGWQNTIRHNLSLNRCFRKLPKSVLGDGTKGKGGYWTIDPNHMAKFKNGAFARGSSSTLRRKSNTEEVLEDSNVPDERQEQTKSQETSQKPSIDLPSKTVQPSLMNSPLTPGLQQLPSPLVSSTSSSSMYHPSPLTSPTQLRHHSLQHKHMINQFPVKQSSISPKPSISSPSSSISSSSVQPMSPVQPPKQPLHPLKLQTLLSPSSSASSTSTSPSSMTSNSCSSSPSLLLPSSTAMNIHNLLN